MGAGELATRFEDHDNWKSDDLSRSASSHALVNKASSRLADQCLSQIPKEIQSKAVVLDVSDDTGWYRYRPLT